MISRPVAQAILSAAAVFAAAPAIAESYSVEIRVVEFVTTDEATCELLARSLPQRIDPQTKKPWPDSPELESRRLLAAVEKMSKPQFDIRLALAADLDEEEPFRVQLPGVYIDGQLLLKQERDGTFRATLQNVNVDGRESGSNASVATTVQVDCPLNQSSALRIGGFGSSTSEANGRVTILWRSIFVEVRVSKEKVARGIPQRAYERSAGTL